MQVILEALCRRYAPRVRAGGVLHLTHDNDPLLMAAFKALGWNDQHPEHAAPEAAVVRAPERAALPKAKGRIW